MMKVSVNREKCQGHNRCYMICPQVYKVDADTYAYIEEEDVPEALRDQVRRGAEVCPEKAITLIE